MPHPILELDGPGGSRVLGRWLVAAAFSVVVNGTILFAVLPDAEPTRRPERAPAIAIVEVAPPLVEPEPRPPDRPPTRSARPSEAEAEVPRAAIALPSLTLPTTDAHEPSATDVRLAERPGRFLAIDRVDLAAGLPAWTVSSNSSRAGAPGAPDPPSAGWNEGPRLAGALDLERFYPPSARRLEVEGATRLRVSIDERGRVLEVQVLESDPAGVFDRAARRLGMSLRFEPATRSGVDVASSATMRIVWRLDR